MQQVLFQCSFKLCRVTNTVSQNTSFEVDSPRKDTVHNPCFSLISTALQHVQTLSTCHKTSLRG